MMIRVKNPGMFSTIQDLGRYGYTHLGISIVGAADRLSLRIANLLVGNQENTPALEMTLLGATLEFEERRIVALAGADCDAKIGASPIRSQEAVEVPAGGVLNEAMYTTKQPLLPSPDAARFSSKRELPVPNAKSDHLRIVYYDDEGERPIPLSRLKAAENQR